MTAANRWWACNRGHSIPITGDVPRVYYATCPECPAGLSTPYRVERDAPEDDPSRLVTAPLVGIPEGVLVGQLDIFGGEVTL